MRVMTGISDLFEPLEQVITTVFLKALLKRDVKAIEREMLTLLARLEGLGLTNPVAARRFGPDEPSCSQQISPRKLYQNKRASSRVVSRAIDVIGTD